MIGVHIQTLIFTDASNIGLTHIIIVGLDLIRVDIIFDKIDATLFDIKHQGTMITNRNAGLDTVFLADCFDTRGQFCFQFLRYVCHLILRFASVCDYYRPKSI